MKKYVFAVDGMYCGMCESHVNDAIRRVCDARTVKASRHRKEAVVIGNQLDVDRVIKALSDLGYEAKLTEESEYEKSPLFQPLGGREL